MEELDYEEPEKKEKTKGSFAKGVLIGAGGMLFVGIAVLFLAVNHFV